MSLLGEADSECVLGQRPWLQIFGDEAPQVPKPGYPPSKDQGRWADVNLSNVVVRVLSKDECPADIAVARLTSHNVSCEPGR